MEDRCHMKITCAAADEAAFRGLGFRPIERRGAVVIMEDPAAPHAHDGDLPWHAVYQGSHSHSVQYDGAMFACNGQTFASIAVGQEGGVLVHLESDGSIFASDQEAWLRFVAINREVTAALAELEAHHEVVPLSPTLEELKFLAVLEGRHDTWIVEMIHQTAREWIAAIQGSLSRELTRNEKEQLIAAYKAGHFQSGLSNEADSTTSPGALIYEI